jgi:hypothetical protein
MAKLSCEAVGIDRSLVHGLEMFKSLEAMFNNPISEPEVIFLPTNIPDEAEFQLRISDFMYKLVQLLGVIHSATISKDVFRREERLHAVVSPAEFRWVGGVKKTSVAASALSLRRNPTEEDPVLIVVVCLDINPPVSAPCSNQLILQFLGRNGWMGGRHDPGPEHFFHFARPEYNRFSENPQPAFDMKKMEALESMDSDLPKFERFLAEWKVRPGKGDFWEAYKAHCSHDDSDLVQLPVDKSQFQVSEESAKPTPGFTRGSEMPGNMAFFVQSLGEIQSYSFQQHWCL